MAHFMLALVVCVVLAVLVPGALGGYCVREFPVLSADELPHDFLGDALAEVNETLSAQFDQGGATGFAYAVVYGDGVLQTGAFGVVDHESNVPVTPSTPFRVFSCTKVLTSLTMLAMRDLGLVRIDIPAWEYMPELLSVPNRFSRVRGRGGDMTGSSATNAVQFTLEDLSMHSAGLGHDPPCVDGDADRSRTCNATYVEMLERWAHAGGPIMPPNRQGAYSNFGMALLGHVLATSQGATPESALEVYQALARRHVLDPLNMTESTFELSEVRSSIARAYSDKGRVQPLVEETFGMPSHGLYSTALDLAKMVSALFRTDALAVEPQNGNIVTGASMRAASRGSAYVQQDDDEHDAWGMGWRVLSRPKGNLPWGPIVFKTGYRTEHYEALVAGVPSLGIGIALTQSSGPSSGINMWDGFEALSDILAPAAYSELSAVLPVNPPPPSSVPVDSFLGTYFIHNIRDVPIPLGPVTVQQGKGGGLEIVLPPLPIPLPTDAVPLVYFGNATVDGVTRHLFQLVQHTTDCSLFDQPTFAVEMFVQETCVAFVVPTMAAEVTGLKVGSAPSCLSTISL